MSDQLPRLSSYLWVRNPVVIGAGYAELSSSSNAIQGFKL